VTGLINIKNFKNPNMKFLNNKIAAFLMLSAVLFASCKKVEIPSQLGDRGQTIVKIANASDAGLGNNYALINVDYVTTSQTVLLLDLRRDVPNSAELAKSLTVTIVLDTTLINKYNLDNSAALDTLSRALYSIVGATPGATYGTWNVTFAPGEFAHPVYITVPNAQLISLLTRHAWGFTLYVATDATDAGRVAFDKRSIVVEIGAKNKYDGKYKITGTMVDYLNPAFVGLYPLNWDVITTGQYTDDVYDNVNLGVPGHLFDNAGTPTYYGEFGLSLTFDPATDFISNLVNYYGCPSPGRARCAVLDPGGLNRFNNSDHSIDITYWLTQGGANRTLFTEHWAYTGPR
jgi:hypothetical protein